MKKIDILECTLRDGSYAIDYQFTAEDTAVISRGLEDAGFKFIEIGHGLGLGASLKKYGSAAATDEEYLVAAQKAVKNAKFGMFCIPGIAALGDLKKAARCNIGFIRIGTNVTEIERAEPFIKKAKDSGIMVFSNLMKSYAVSSLEFADKVRRVSAYGADVVCVVDSAGGMLPDDVREYIKIVKDQTNAKIGFHGHDNLRLAVANSLEAVKAGATIVDASLRGLGRSSGNAQTEILGILLEKTGYDCGIDLYKTLELGEKIIKPITWEGKGVDAISAMLGATQFHSSFMKFIKRFAQKYSVDEKKLIAEVSKIDKVNVTEELVENVAKKIKPAKRHFMSMHFDLNPAGLIKKYGVKNIKDISLGIVNEMTAISKKSGKKIIFTLARTSNKNKKYTTFPFIRYNEIYIIGNAEVAKDRDALSIARVIDGYVDFILIDYFLYNDLAESFSGFKSIVLPYDDLGAQVISVNKIVSLLSKKKSPTVFISGKNYLTQNIIIRFLSQGYCVISEGLFGKELLTGKFKGRLLAQDKKNIKTADFIIGLTPFEGSITKELLLNIRKNTVVLDAGPGSITGEAITYSLKCGIPIYRIDMRAGLFGETEAVLKSYYLKQDVIGEKKIKGIRIVSGGVMGKKGDLVIDSIKNPSRIIGVADGKGGLIIDKAVNRYSSAIQVISDYLARSKFL